MNENKYISFVNENMRVSFQRQPSDHVRLFSSGRRFMFSSFTSKKNGHDLGANSASVNIEQVRLFL